MPAKYIMYCIVSNKDRATDTVSVYSVCTKFCQVWTLIFETCEQTDRRTNISITILRVPARAK